MPKHHSWLRRANRAVCCVITAAFLAATAGPAWSWQTGHGHTDNSGFVDVPTAAVKTPIATIPRLGGIGAGAGPVVAPNGTVYIGNARGKLMSFSADGTPGWSIDLGAPIPASPALSGEGSIYVVSTASVRDHTVEPVVTRTITQLHKVSHAGVEIWRKALPRVYAGLIGSAPPNVWIFDGSEVVLVPSVFRQDGGQFEAHLTAFASTGEFLADTKIGSLFGDVTGEWADLFSFGAPEATPVERTVNDLPEKIIYPFPAAAIYAPAPNVEPKIFVTDGYRDVVGYTFNGEFKEFYREHLTDGFVLSTPMAWIDGHAVLSIGGGSKLPEIFFAAEFQASRIPGPYSIAAPTQMSNARIAFVEYGGGLTVMRGAATVRTVTLPGQSMASAAASRTHLFVSTASALHVFDAQLIEEVAKFDWVRGGMSPPVIGPQGHVYAVADDKLYIFAPPVKSSATADAGPLGGASSPSATRSCRPAGSRRATRRR
jgi:hypothetical protein